MIIVTQRWYQRPTLRTSAILGLLVHPVVLWAEALADAVAVEGWLPLLTAEVDGVHTSLGHRRVSLSRLEQV
jgi:hypothetical protein